ncbi:unnamed protein product [Urochloa decumbens]|uniref:F-box domain-containing protein n=1 Tax=Urochloa decumbens TaxID=240449 RepID=A0ABC8Z173_9POAL
MAATQAITPGGDGGGGGEEVPPTVAPHLDDGVVSDILHRLPSKDAYRLTLVCPRWREIISGPAFLSRHLFPRPTPPPLVDEDLPRALILQPRRKVGYTHLTLVPTDPADAFHLNLNLPLDPKYKSDGPRSRSRHKIKPPTPGLCDTATDNFILSSLYSDDANEDPADELSGGGAVGDGNAAVEDPDHKSENDGAVSVDEAEEAAVPAGEEAAPPPTNSPVPDYVVFFECTVPMLDISFVASHGRLLLGRSRTRYYVCDAAANRWLALPPPPTSPTKDTATGLHYDLDAAAGRVSFTVVVLSRTRRRRLRVETFLSATGRWEAADVPGAQGAARRLGGVASPGIRVGACFYWLCRRRGHVVRYDAARGRASVVGEPPEAEESKGRAWRSLGSVGGHLRMCAFDIRDEESSNMLPHDGVEGVHGVWVMDAGAGAPAAWRRVHEAVVEDMSTYYFNMLWGHEMALDFAGACTDSIVVDKDKFLLRYDLVSGEKVRLASLYRDDGKLGALYGRFRVFPFYMPG